MKSKLVLALSLVLSSLSARATVDSSVEINLSATVNRSCLVDLAPADQATKLSDTKNISIQLAPREASAVGTTSIDIYETCNEDYRINLKSDNGGLKHDGSTFVKPYDITYTGPTGETIANSAALTGIGTPVLRTVSAWRAIDPENRTNGTTPYFQPETLSIFTPKSADLPKGDYTDKITVEMATVE